MGSLRVRVMVMALVLVLLYPAVSYAQASDSEIAQFLLELAGYLLLRFVAPIAAFFMLLTALGSHQPAPAAASKAQPAKKPRDINAYVISCLLVCVLIFGTCAYVNNDRLFIISNGIFDLIVSVVAAIWIKWPRLR